MLVVGNVNQSVTKSVRSLAMRWSFSNKASALPQLLSFHGAQEEKAKTGFDSLASTGLVKITTTETLDPENKSYSGVVQENFAPEENDGVRYTVTTYRPKHHDTHAVHHPATSQTSLTVLPALGTAARQSFVAASGQNMTGYVSPQPLARDLVASPVPAMPSGGPVVGITDLRNGSKISCAPSQLTIFYNGSVCVYDNISPEKAQAIMLLAGNGPPVSAPVKAPMPRSSVLDGLVVTQPSGTSVAHSSPTPVTSNGVPRSAGNSGTIIEATTSKSAGGVLVSYNKVEPLQGVNSPGSVSANFLPSDTVPQLHRKSLARFLEKRKERVVNASPFARQQSPDSRSARGAGNTHLTMKSSGSCPVPITN